MRLTADYHTHTKYSDGRASVLQNALRAKELGLEEIAITEHGFSHIILGLKRKKLDKYLKDIEDARAKTGMNILVGIEGNILGQEGTSDLKEDDFQKFDLYLAGIHIFVHYESGHDSRNGWKGFFKYNLHTKPSQTLIREQTLGFIHAVERNPIDVLTHVNYQCFCDSVEVAKCCADYGTYIEISGKKPHFTDEELAKVAETGVRFIVNSDAHSPKRIGDIKIAMEQIERVGVPLDRIDNLDGRLPKFRLKDYKERHL